AADERRRVLDLGNRLPRYAGVRRRSVYDLVVDVAKADLLRYQAADLFGPRAECHRDRDDLYPHWRPSLSVHGSGHGGAVMAGGGTAAERHWPWPRAASNHLNAMKS